MKTKFNKLLKFPCLFTYKIIGIAKPELVDQILEVVQRHLIGDYSSKIKPSNKGNYYSISVTITATNIEQVEILYEKLSKIDAVYMVF